MANKAAVPFLVTMMLVTGVCNTILNKYQVGLPYCGLPHLLAHPTNRTCNVYGIAIRPLPNTVAPLSNLSSKRRHSPLCASLHAPAHNLPWTAVSRCSPEKWDAGW